MLLNKISIYTLCFYSTHCVFILGLYVTYFLIPRTKEYHNNHHSNAASMITTPFFTWFLSTVYFLKYLYLLGQDTRTIRVDGDEHTTRVSSKITLNVLQVHEVNYRNEIKTSIVDVEQRVLNK